MTIHFAAARTTAAPACPPIARGLVRRARDRAANDNGIANPDGRARQKMQAAAPSEPVLRAALRHFSEHGLGAARAARARAESAFFAGDRQAYDWWLEITRTLDRRLAAEFERRGA